MSAPECQLVLEFAQSMAWLWWVGVPVGIIAAVVVGWWLRGYVEPGYSEWLSGDVVECGCVGGCVCVCRSEADTHTHQGASK